MRYIVNTKARMEAAISPTFLLPALLTFNTLLLLGIEQTQGIPHWLKVAATLFLSF
ncbi:MAG: hypothetical protein WBX15_10340 [Thermoanaerobaculia bacterium]